MLRECALPLSRQVSNSHSTAFASFEKHFQAPRVSSDGISSFPIAKTSPKAKRFRRDNSIPNINGSTLVRFYTNRFMQGLETVGETIPLCPRSSDPTRVLHFLPACERSFDIREYGDPSPLQGSYNRIATDSQYMQQRNLSNLRGLTNC